MCKLMKQLSDIQVLLMIDVIDEAVASVRKMMLWVNLLKLFVKLV